MTPQPFLAARKSGRSRRDLARDAARCLVPLIALFLPACRSTPPLPPARLDAPGWSLRQGQAVWNDGRSADGVAGELLVATRDDGACLVQFAKPPFTLATARSEAGSWELETAGNRRLHGRGAAPSRSVWFALASAVHGTSPGAAWRWESRPGGGWRLVQPHTGESLEGVWSP